jgi:hypothetical protein
MKRIKQSFGKLTKFFCSGFRKINLRKVILRYQMIDDLWSVKCMQCEILNVKIPAARLDLRKNFFSVRVCEKWNNLPSDIKCSGNVKSFKRNYRRYMGSTRPKQRTSQCRTQETNGTRPDEQFPEGPYLSRWESIYKYTSK